MELSHFVRGRLSRRLRPAVVSVALIGAFVAPLAEEAIACATTHGRPYLTAFRGGSDAGSQFYAGVEGSTANATIGVTPGHCVTQGGSTAAYQTEDGLATAAQDYGSVSGTSQRLCADVDGPAQEDIYCPPDSEPQRPITVPITNDAPAEAAVEPFLFRLTSGQPAGLAEPSFAPIHVIDDDGTSRASLEPTINGAAAVTYSRSESFTTILIPVFLAGPTSGSVGYDVQPGGAAPATPGQDFTVLSPNPLPIDAGRVGFMEIGIVNDKIGESSETVSIRLTGAVDGPSSTTLTIIDNEENERPSSRFHHPRDNWRYKKSDYRIREVHVFATDTGGAGVTGSQLALRRNMKNSDCVWLTKEGWQKKDCSNRQWLPLTYDETGNLFYYRLRQLKSSVRTRIVDYTAFSRAIDGAENVETDFDKKRNDNTFEIKRTRRRR